MTGLFLQLQLNRRIFIYDLQCLIWTAKALICDLLVQIQFKKPLHQHPVQRKLLRQLFIACIADLNSIPYELHILPCFFRKDTLTMDKRKLFPVSILFLFFDRLNKITQIAQHIAPATVFLNLKGQRVALSSVIIIPPGLIQLWNQLDRPFRLLLLHPASHRICLHGQQHLFV